jgi:prepilin-type processing-associated H-X9-DG protein
VQFTLGLSGRLIFGWVCFLFAENNERSKNSMTKATKRTIGVICLLWLGTLLLLFANYKTKVYLEQLRSQVDAVTQQEQANATAVKRQPSRTMEDVLVRTDAQLVTTSFSNENYAAKAKSLVSLCDKELKEKTGGVSNESVQAEMQRRPGMNGRLVIPSVGVNVALFDGHAQRFVDAKDSAAYFLAGNTMVVGDHWNQGFSKIKNCHAGTLAYIYRGTSVQTLTCTGVCSGINGDSDLLYADGSSATMGGGTLMYTCNGANYHDVTLTFWR